MLRSRVRRSFTVEVKSKARQTSSWPEDPTPSPVNWAALDPAPETPSPFEAVWADAAAVKSPAAAEAPSAPAEKPRRILQSLIVAEPEPEPAEPAVAREPPLPRVRRVKPPRAQPDASERAASEPAAKRSPTRGSAARPPEATRADAVWSFSDIADAAPDLPAPAIPDRPAPAAVVPARMPAKPRTKEPALAPGQRWKRRLPRSCW